MKRAHIRKFVAVALALLAAVLAACGADGDAPEFVPTHTTEPSPSQMTAPDPGPEASEETMNETHIRIVIGDQTLNGTLVNNPAAQSLLAQLPLTLQFSDYGGQEVTAVPPHPIMMEGMPAADAADTGDITYYAPDGVVVLHYSDIGRWNGIAKLGRIDEDISILKGRNAPFPVTIERAD